MTNNPTDYRGPQKIQKERFEPNEIDLGEMASDCHNGFLAFVPLRIEEDDFDKKWWPRLKGFPFNIAYSSSRQNQDGRPAVATALYEPYLATFRETHIERELSYFNRLGGNYRVSVVLNNTGGMKTFKYKGEKLMALAAGHKFETTIIQTTLIGIQLDELAICL